MAHRFTFVSALAGSSTARRVHLFAALDRELAAEQTMIARCLAALEPDRPSRRRHTGSRRRRWTEAEDQELRRLYPDTIHNLPRPLADVIRLRGAVVKQIRRRERASA